MFSKKPHVDVKRSSLKVLEIKRDSPSRLKHLRVYLDNVDNLEAKVFFENNYSHIYHIFHDCFTNLESSLKQRVHKAQKEELDNVRYIFEKILTLLPELLAKRWQWNSIRIIMKKLLHPGNSIKLRREGVRLFVIWYQILGDAAPSEITQMYTNLVPGLIPGSPSAISSSHQRTDSDSTFYAPLEAESGPAISGEMFALVPPQIGENQPENITCAYLEYLMDYMVTQVKKIYWNEMQEQKHFSSFQFLFAQFKKYYLPHVFPHFSSTNNIYEPNLELPCLRKNFVLEGDEVQVHQKDCASQCQSVIVQWVVNYTQKPRKETAVSKALSKSDCVDGTEKQYNESDNHSASATSMFSISSLSQKDSGPHVSLDDLNNLHRSLVQDTLYGFRENVNFVHEVYRQALLFPFGQFGATKDVISVYREWIQMTYPDTPPFLLEPLDSREEEPKQEPENVQLSSLESSEELKLAKKNEIRAGLQNVLKAFITNAANIFLLEIPPEDKVWLEQQVDLCKRVMNLYRYMVMRKHMEKNTWEQLLLILLQITSLVLKTVPPSRKEDTLGGRLAPALFQTLIVTWIKASLHIAISTELWDQFLIVLSSLTLWEELIKEWAKTMDTLTRILAQHVYKLNLCDLPLERQKGKRIKNQSSSPNQRNISNDIGKRESSANARGSSVPSSPLLHGEDKDGDLHQVERTRSSSGDGGAFTSDHLLERSVCFSRSYSDGHLLYHKVIRMRRNLAASSAAAQDKFDVTSVSSEASSQHESRLSSLNRSKSLDFLSVRAESPCFSHGSDYRSRSPSPTPSSGLENTSIKDSPIQIDVMVASSENSSDATVPVNDQRSVMAGGGVRGWLPEVAVVLWKRMLGALGNINSIQDPVIHAQVMEVLTDLSESLVKIRDNQGVPEDQTCTPTPPSLVPPLLLIVPWLFEATILPDKFLKGKLYAYHLLCYLTVRRHDILLSSDYLAHFYHTLHQGLSGTDQRVINTIIKYCGRKFFSSSLKGHTILLLDFINAANTIVSSTSSKGMPRVEAVTLLGSLVCFPVVFKDTKVLQPNPSLLSLMTLEETKEHIVNILLKAGKRDPDSNARSLALCGLGIFIYEELSHKTNHLKVREAITVLLSSLKVNNQTVAQIACDILQLLCDHAMYLLDTFSDIPIIIIEVLASTLTFLLPTENSGSEEGNKRLVLSLLFCLADWCMVLPLKVLRASFEEGRSPLLTLLRVLDLAITGKGSNRSNTSSLLPNLADSEVDSDHPVENTKSMDSPHVQMKIPKVMTSFISPSTLQNELKKGLSASLAARTILGHLMNHLGHFPMALGAAHLASFVTEHDDVPSLTGDELSKEVFGAPNIQFFVLNNSAILSLVEIPAQEIPAGGASVGLTAAKAQARVIFRDLSGKFVWDCLALYGPHGCRAGSFPPGPVPDPCMQYSSSRSVRNLESSDKVSYTSGRRSPQHRAPDQLPLLENSREDLDNLDDLLQYIGHISPECIQAPNQPLNSAPRATTEAASLKEADTINLILNQHNQEVTHTSSSVHKPEMLARPVQPFNTTDPESPFQFSRLLLDNLCFFTWEKRPKFDLLKKNEKLLRELKNLDHQWCRETHKIAVIYVGEGQEDKNSILLNQSGSSAFEEFVAGLGWEVDLETHAGFRGGLQSNHSTGDTAPYYATSFSEVIFHVSTRIPSTSEKESLTKKLRHIGNDEVHIVWSEHTRDYRRGIIPTEFGDVLIIIYPLGNWLYRIQINPKPDVPSFGPLFDGAIIDHKVLPGLVRATAINAGRVLQSSRPLFRTYYEERANSLDTIVKNYKDAMTFEEFSSKVFAPAPVRSPIALRKSGLSGADNISSHDGGSTLAAALLDSSPGRTSPSTRPRPASLSGTGERTSPDSSPTITRGIGERPLSASHSHTSASLSNQ